MKRKFGFKGAIAITVNAASIAALIISKPPQTEQIRQNECPAEQKAVELKKGDLVCNVEMGEADPLSDNFDFISCGSCGDGVRQEKAEKGTNIRLDIDGMFHYQYVTGRESETRENCPVDFHCGNNKLEQGTPYSGIIYEDGKYKYSRVHVFESCYLNSKNFCPQDCRKNKKKIELEEVVIDDKPKLPVSGVLTCFDQIAGKTRIDLISLSSIGGDSVRSRLSSLVRTKSSAIRNVLGMGPDDPVKILISMDVNHQGLIKLKDVTAVCDNDVCSNSSAVEPILSINLGGLTLSAPGKSCTWSSAFRVP